MVFDQETDGTFAGGTISTSNITKEGSGTVSSIYTGITMVNAGALAINGGITSGTTFGANDMLASAGTFIGDVVVNGTMSAGNSTGTLGIVGNYTSTSGSGTQVEIGGAETAPGVKRRPGRRHRRGDG